MCAFLKRFFFLIFLRWPFILLGAAALLHILKVIQVDGYGIGLILIAFLPILLPVISTYFKTFKIGKDGFEATTVADNEGRPVFDFEAREEVVNSITTAPGPFQYGINSRRVLATLWHYQKELFGEDSLRRWGFGVGLGAPGFTDFSSGVSPLVVAGLVHVDNRGLCYLTNQGLTFCQQQRVFLDADGPFYRYFSPVTVNG